MTVAGQQPISTHALERGQLVEQVLIANLPNPHAELDRQVINGSGASGQHLGILGVAGITSLAYTDATLTGVGCGRNLRDAVRQVGCQLSRARFLSLDFTVAHGATSMSVRRKTSSLAWV